ncbi:MAG: hypothetical protein HYY08_03840 [Firmicutes bacterium]|nr:hypothetical protein [Bacillota bacterium]
MPQGLKMIKSFSERSDHRIPVSLLDLGAPMNGALDILGGDLLFSAIYDHPEAVHFLLELLTDTVILFTEESIKAARGIDNITATDFPEWWQPEGRKGHVSDDVCSSFSPEFFEKFSIPVNSRVFRRFGASMMHNCGPHPAASKYLDQGGGIVAADIAYRYSKKDLAAIKRAFSGRGMI